jgi:copper chaperone CopZ
MSLKNRNITCTGCVRKVTSKLALSPPHPQLYMVAREMGS